MITNCNAKDYGVAQNRERVFIVSILGEYNYTFPKPIPLTKRLKDYLEDEVDEKYYLSDKQIAKIQNSGFMQEKSRIHNPNGIIGTLLARDYKDPKCVDLSLIMPEKTEKGYALAQDGDGVYINRPHQKRGVVQKGMIQTIKTSPNDIGVVVKDSENYIYHKSLGGIDNARRAYKTNKIMGTITTHQDNSKVLLDNPLRIRKLTPREALRLMDVSESDIDIITNTVSNAQAYKLAGNSIVVSVLEAIFRNLF